MKSFPGRGLAQRALRAASCAAARAAAPFRRFDVSIFHQFAPPPDGGGHQFLRGLVRCLEERGWKVENNSVSGTTRACLFNSFNFDAARLRRLRRPGCRMVHRLDDPQRDLPPIDQLEGFRAGGHSMYQRVMVAVLCGRTSIPAWTYWMPCPSYAERVASGEWLRP